MKRSHFEGRIALSAGAEWLAIRFCSFYLAADALWTKLDFRRESIILAAWC